MKTTEVVVLEYHDDGKVILIRFVDGKKYKLQHPGNRTYLEWQKEFFSLTEGIDQAKFLDKAFEYCVIPEGHESRPTVDDVKPAELGVWSTLLRRFCDGKLHAMVERPEKATKGKRAESEDTAGS